MNKIIPGAAAVLALLHVPAAPAAAQVRDAVYRGTLVCARVAPIKGAERAAIEVQIKSGAVTYSRAAVAGKASGTETGTGTLDGDKIALKGSFKDQSQGYEASYAGTFVRRSAKLTGTQVWTIDGKTYSRDCSGAIKRPFAPLLPKDKKT